MCTQKGTPMKNVIRNAAAFLLVALMALAIAWFSGCNFDGTWDAPQDHPTNWLDTAQHPEAKLAHGTHG